jgi:hypothetical protein
MSAHEKNRTRRVLCLERLDDVVISVRGTFGEFPAEVCYSAAQLTLIAYLTSGAGDDAAENTRSKVARSAPGKSETAM